LNDDFSQGDCPVKNERNYHRRAAECTAFAKIARDEEERSQMLNMAEMLQRIAVEDEKKSMRARTTKS
jgi:hypothetical protein